MKKFIITLLSIGLLFAGAVQAEAEQKTELNNPGGIGGVESLRGASELEATRPADDFKRFPRDHALESDMFINHHWFLILFVITKCL
jgi:cytochrome c-type protein NapB